MGVLTIRDLDDTVARRLKERAAARGISAEEQARQLLAESAKPRRRKHSIFAELTRLGIKPEEPFDLKELTDEMWDEGLL